VGDGVITLQDRAGGEPFCIPFGVCIWAAGVKPNDLVQRIMDRLPEGSQTNQRALTTDKMLRVKGSGGSIYAVGDCSTIERPNSLACAERLYGDRARTIGLKEFERVLAEGSKEFPHLEELAKRAQSDDDSIQVQRLQLGAEIDFEGFQQLLRREDDQLRALPATAQVAKQEAEYLAQSFDSAGGDPDKLLQTALKFQYAHKGSLAYVGADAAVLDIPGMGIVQGIAAGFIWKGFETFSQFSVRNQILVLSDLIRAKVFGRDTSAI
jgi:NADH:ubiquinone reductase (non-electrogenic)